MKLQGRKLSVEMQGDVVRPQRPWLKGKTHIEALANVLAQ